MTRIRERIGAQGSDQFPMTQTQYDRLGMTDQIPPPAQAAESPEQPPPTPKPGIFWGAFNAAADVIYKLVRRSSGENPNG